MRISINRDGHPVSELERDWLELEGIMEDRQAGRRFFEQAAQLLAPGIRELSTEAQNEFWRLMFAAAEKRHKPRPQPANPRGIAAPAPSPARQVVIEATARRKEADERVGQARELIASIHALAEQLPPRGEDFGLSVCEKADDISASIDEAGSVTDGQITALENMLSGLERWIR